MSMADRDGVIWLDGQLVPWREAKVHVLTHTLHYGLGVFEGVRAYQTDRGAAIFRLREHALPQLHHYRRAPHRRALKHPRLRSPPSHVLLRRRSLGAARRISTWDG